MKKSPNLLEQNLKLIIFAFSGLNISSCSIEEDILGYNKNRNKNFMQKTTLKNLGYSSYKMMFDDGWELISRQEIEPRLCIRNEKNEENKLEKIKEKITSKHLQELGYYFPYSSSWLPVRMDIWHLINQKAIQCEEELKSLYIKSGKIPDGITINDYKTKGGFQSDLSERYNQYAYIETGIPKIIKETVDTLYNDVLEYTWLQNESNIEDQANLNYTMTRTKGVYWENTSNLSIAVGGKVGIPLVSEGAVTITMGYSHTWGGSETVSEAFSYAYWVKLPPKTKRQIVLKKKIIQKIIKCEIPVSIRGTVVANFPKPVDGHYFWFFPANLLLKDKPITLTYDIKIEDKGGIEIYGRPEIPL